MARRWEHGVNCWSPGKSPLSRLLACIVSSTRRCDVSIILFSSLFPFNLAASIFFVHGFLSWPRPRFPLKNFVKPLLHPRAYWSPLLVLSAKYLPLALVLEDRSPGLAGFLASPPRLLSGVPGLLAFRHFLRLVLRVSFLFCCFPDLTVINLLPASPNRPPPIACSAVKGPGLLQDSGRGLPPLGAWAGTPQWPFPRDPLWGASVSALGL